MLYSQLSALGVGIIKITTIIAIETLKQYIGSMRSQNKVSEMINAISELEIVWYRYNNNLQCNKQKQFQQSIWIDLCNHYMKVRDITLLNTIYYPKEITKNIIIIDYTLRYMESWKNKVETL